ncbi:DNA methyltransferase [Nautilia sp.]
MFEVYKAEAYKMTSYLLKNNYKGKFNLIYLDPPYNTKRLRGARKLYGDALTNWSFFIKNIINNSYELLNKNGFLCVSINQMELFNLKNIIDNVFSPELFIGLFPVKIRHNKRQLMINATFHDVYEYILIYRKDKSNRFYMEYKEPNLDKFIYKIETFDKPKIEYIKDKKIEIYSNYRIYKDKPSKDNLRRYIIAGKIATANWSGEFFENHLRKYGNNKLIKVYGLDKNGLGFRWFETQNEKRKSGVYFQSTLTAGRHILPSNDLDFTEIVPNIYKEGGEGCDFKDSKKPEDLLKYLIEITTKENDLVGDFFAGSGTTIATCVKTNRRCITSDINENAIDITLKRLENLKQGKDIDKKVYNFDYIYKEI